MLLVYCLLKNYYLLLKIMKYHYCDCSPLEGMVQMLIKLSGINKMNKSQHYQKEKGKVWLVYLHATFMYAIMLSSILIHLMHAIAYALVSIHTTSLMHVKKSMCHFCLWYLLSGTLQWRKWKHQTTNWIVDHFSLVFVNLLLNIH